MTRIRNELVPQLPATPSSAKSSLTITMIEVKPGAFNVVPEECRFAIDCRNTPNYTAENLYHDLQALIADQSGKDPEFKASVLPTPLIRGERIFNGFYTDPKDLPRRRGGGGRHQRRPRQGPEEEGLDIRHRR